MTKQIVYTVGHSNHSIDYFVELLNTYLVTCIIDVRSIAASSYNPQYNKDGLSDFLKKRGVNYMHFSEEFGARHADPQLLDSEGKVDFGKVRSSKPFAAGIERLKKGLDKGFVIALMCSESEPFDCHRFSMISVALQGQGFDVRHIMKDKTCKTQAELENVLLKKYDKKVPKPDIFNPEVSLSEQLEVAYRLRNREIAYSPYSNDTEERTYD